MIYVDDLIEAIPEKDNQIENNLIQIMQKYYIKKLELEKEILELKLQKTNIITESIKENAVELLNDDIEDLCNKITSKNEELSVLFELNNTLQNEKLHLQEKSDLLSDKLETLEDKFTCEMDKHLNDLEEDKKRIDELFKNLSVKDNKINSQDSLILKLKHREKILKAQVDVHKSYRKKYLQELSQYKSRTNKYEDRHKHDKQELLNIKRTVRYKLGNAIVLGVKPSKHTILLPYRIVKLFLEGCRKTSKRKKRLKETKLLTCEVNTGNKTNEKFIAKQKKKVNNLIDKNINIKMIDDKFEDTIIRDIEQIEQIRNVNELEKIYNNTENKKKFQVGRILYRRYKTLGYLNKCVKLLNELLLLNPNNTFLNRELSINEDKLQLLNDSKYRELSNETNAFNISQDNNKVLHVLNTSIPYLKNGYSIRAKYIVESQKKVGIEPIVITRPGFPNDFSEGQIRNKKELIKEEVNGITYYRCLPKLFMRHTPLKKYLKNYSRQMCKVAELEKPFAIHAASNYINGLAALETSRKLKLPFVYEIRGFWELTTVSKEPLFRDSEEFKLAQVMETYLANHADKVIVISEGLREELIKRGVSEDKISIVPNGVDCEIFQSLDYNTELSKKYNIQNQFVIGYIGSIVKYEGLQTLIKAIAEIKNQGYKDIRVVIAGDGNYKNELEKLTKELRLENEIIFAGRIPHEEVIQHYSLFDMCVFPRVEEEVTNIVTPLKPLEAMACKKIVVGSNLDAIKEMIMEGVNGFIFDNSIEDLCKKIKMVYENKNLRSAMKEKARYWVEENRDWNKLALRYKKEYDRMIESALSKL